MREEMKDTKKINQMEFLEMNTLDRINSRFSTTEEKIIEFADMETNYPKWRWEDIYLLLRVESCKESHFYS